MSNIKDNMVDVLGRLTCGADRIHRLISYFEELSPVDLYTGDALNTKESLGARKMIFECHALACDIANLEKQIKNNELKIKEFIDACGTELPERLTLLANFIKFAARPYHEVLK